MSRKKSQTSTLESLNNVDDQFSIHKDDTSYANSKNLFLPLQQRLQSLKECYKENPDDFAELISSIIGMYFFSKTINLFEYLNEICQDRDFPVLYRIECAKSLGEIGYKHINQIITFDYEQLRLLPTPIIVDTVIYLMKGTDYRNEAREHFINIIIDKSIDTLYRFRTIQSLERHFNNDKESFMFYALDSCTKFLENELTFSYRIIMSQYILEKCNPSHDVVMFVESFLIKAIEDTTLDDDLRADACDILLQNGSDDARLKATDVIYTLGGGDRSRNNIFKNKQNVHSRSIEESVERILEKLCVYHPHNNTTYNFDQTQEMIQEKLKKSGDSNNDNSDNNDNNDNSNNKKVEGALTRISIDRAVYGKSNMTLTTILAKIWTYIQDSEFKVDLENRLIEELVDSNNKCSSGYAARLINTLSGYDENMTIRISFEEQIIANLETRLNKEIELIEDENERDNILDEMTLPVILYHARTNFLTFFRRCISKIREEMYQEFRTYMEDIDYDFYFRKAIIHYEGCS
jgi:hypothetical protein